VLPEPELTGGNAGVASGGCVSSCLRPACSLGLETGDVLQQVGLAGELDEEGLSRPAGPVSVSSRKAKLACVSSSSGVALAHADVDQQA